MSNTTESAADRETDPVVPESWTALQVAQLLRGGRWRTPAGGLLVAVGLALTLSCWAWGRYGAGSPWGRLGFDGWPIALSPSFAACLVVMFWFGVDFALVPALAACAGMGAAAALPGHYLAPFLLTDAAALAILAICYRLSGLPYRPRGTAARLGYGMAALLCALVASSGSFYITQERGTQAQVTMATWEAWWLGSLLDLAAATVVLHFFSPAVERWKRARLVQPQTAEQSRLVRIGVLVAGAAILSVLVFALTDMLWQRMEVTFLSGSAERVGRNLLVLRALWTLMTRVTILWFLALCAGGVVLAWKWNRDLQEAARLRTLAVETAEHRFRTTFSEAPLGIAHVSPTGKFLLANRMFSEIFGYTWEELRERNYLDLVAPEERALARQRAFDLVVGEARSHDFERAFIAKNGDPVWARARITIAQAPDGKPDYCIVLLEDIRQRKEMEEQIRQTSKMEAVGRLAGGVAHDFNNLLTAILGFNEIARNQVGRGQSAMASLEQVQKAAERAAELTRQLLTFSRRQMTQPRLLDLNREIRETLLMLPPLLGPRIEVQFDATDPLPVVMADPSQISQILVNLAANAKDAMPLGGQLRLRTTVTRMTAEQAEKLAGLLPGSHVTLEFHDSGEGIPQELLPKIFEPFFTTKETGRGTGLGLATVYGIVRQNQGAIEVHSSKGEGTTFVIHLPARAGQVSAAAAPEDSVARTESGARVLLVEDEHAVREFLMTALERSGFHVDAMPSAAAALARFAERPYDLVVTDVVMPGMTGVEMASRMRAKGSHVPVLFMSGYSHETRAESLPGRFVAKPFTIDALIEEMRAAIADAPGSSSPPHSAE